jgi:hypothetical protein
MALFALDRALIDTLAQRLARRNAWSVAVSGGQLYVTVGSETLEGRVEPLALSP